MFATWGNNHGQDNFSLYIQGDYIIVEKIKKKERKNKKHILKIMKSGGTYYEKNNSRKRNCNR